VAETLVEKQVRLVQEQQCRDLAEHLAPKLPAGTGFALFIFDYGDGQKKGNVSYISTAAREQMIDLVEDWLRRQGQPVTPVGKRLAAGALRSVAEMLEELAPELADRDSEPVSTIRNVAESLREAAAGLERPLPPEEEPPAAKGQA
jgi:hypothetical protein